MWKHPNRLEASPAIPQGVLLRPGVGRSAMGRGRFSTCANSLSLQPLRSTLLLVLLSTATVLTIFALLIVSHQVELPAAVGNTLAELRISTSTSSTRERFLSRMDHYNARKFSGQVHYFSEVIKRTVRHRSPEAPELAQAIVTEAHRAAYDPFFVAAVIHTESTFNRRARSPVGARGLMQIMPATGRYVSRIHDFRWSGVHELYQPQYNIRLGVAYLKYLERKFDGNLEHVLIAYNWGPTNLDRALRNGTRVPGSPKRYATKVLADFNSWRKEFERRKHEFRFAKLESLIESA